MNKLNIIQGILMLLVIFGHIKGFQLNLNSLVAYIYNFHVLLFFYFVYKASDVSFSKVLERSTRYIYPYLFLTFMLSILSYLLKGEDFSLKAYAFSVLNGTAPVLRESAGFGYLWFIPSAVCILFFGKLLHKFPKINLPVFLMSLCVFSLYYEGYLDKSITSTSLIASVGVSFSLIFFLQTIRVLENFSLNAIKTWIIIIPYIAVSFIVVNYDLRLNVAELSIKSDFSSVFLVVLFLQLNVLCQYAIINRMADFSSNLRCGVWLDYIGSNSFKYFTLHSFISYPLYLLFGSSIVSSLVQYLAVVVLCSSVIYLMDKLNFSRFIFPKGLKWKI